MNQYKEAFHSSLLLLVTGGDSPDLVLYPTSFLENICIYLQQVSCYLHVISEGVVHLLAVEPAASRSL